MSIGPIRLSDTRRYTGASFIPPSRNNWPTNDANDVLITRMNDGAGATVTDYSGNGYNGTITFGATTRWNNTPDLAIDEPGAMIYNQGYNFGSDGANDGIYIPFTLTADTDYVIRVPLRYSPLAWPRITLYDVTGAASIVDFDAPPRSAVHDGAGGAAAFTSTGEVYPASLIGGVIYNPTDGSSGTITAVGGTNQDTITAALAGGGSNDWQVGEQAYIVPPTGWVFNEPISAHTSANTAYELRITNRNSDGIITLHQAEVLLNLLLNGDHEDLNGGFPGAPELITGWTSLALDAGDTEPEAAIIHAGAQSLEWNTIAISDEFMYYGFTPGTNYFCAGVWTRGDGGSRSLRLGTYNKTDATFHNSASAWRFIDPNDSATWVHTAGVWCAVIASPRMSIQAVTGAVADRFSDDIYVIACDDVTLTVTPASAANSLEDTGIRVDGLDTCTVPAADHRMKAGSGAIRFRVTPRHAIANSEAFGQNFEYLLDLTENANNYLRVYRDSAGGGTLTLEANQNGAGAVTDTDTTAWAADTEVLIKVKNVGSRIDLERDGVVVCQLVGLAGFATDFTAVARFGHDATPEHELDGVISPP